MNLEERIEAIEKTNKLIVDNQRLIFEAIYRLHLIQMAQYEIGDFASRSIDIVIDMQDRRLAREQEDRNSKAPVMKDNESMEEFLLRTRQGSPC